MPLPCASMTSTRDDAGEGRLTFPEGFTWGVATAAHQIEGGNTNNDWWAWEHNPDSGTIASSGDACDSFHRWREDVDLVGDLGLSAYRFSLEWSRIEPAEGEFSLAALEHYRRICAACHGRGVVPVVTFHHFTTPQWLTARGGWEAPDAPDCFARFVTRAAAHLGDLIGWACTINEPNVVGVMGYFQGQYPPGVKDDFMRFAAVNEAMVRAHRLAVEVLRAGPGDYPIGLTVSMAEIVAEEGGESLRDAAEEVLENSFLRATEGDDFVGVQCYTRMHFGPDGQAPNDPSVPVTQMDDERWPRAVEFCVRRAAAISGRPVVVTENGIATADDTDRIAFLAEAIASAHRCLEEGIDLRGYFVWSLLDNFEWHLGYGPQFGIVSVAPGTFERRPKPSAYWFGEVAQANALVTAPAQGVPRG
jgi:beta-glucosidase